MRVLKVAWATVFVAATLSSSLAQSLSDLQALAVKRQAAETQDNEEVNRLRPALSKVMDDHVRAATAAIASQGVAFNDTKPILDEQVTNAARISFVAFEPVYLNTKRSIGAEGLLGVNSTYFLSPTGARSYVEIHASLFWLRLGSVLLSSRDWRVWANTFRSNVPMQLLRERGIKINYC